jgi:GDP-L-fucose synthase
MEGCEQMIDQSTFDSFIDKRVLVTGGTGLIGRQVVDLVCKAGARVTVVSLDKVEINPAAERVFGDITEFAFCREITRGMDFVFHLAGIKGSIEVSRSKLASHFVPTIMMNTNILEAARLSKVAKLVFTSSIGAYPNAEIFREADFKLDSIPMDFAGWAKRVAELQISAYKTQYGMENFAVVRPCNVYGPGDNFDPKNAMVIPALMSRIHKGEDPVEIWGDGSAVRDFAYSRDVAEGIILALLRGTKGGFVNLGSGRGATIRELVETLHSFIEFRYVFDSGKPSGAPVRVMDISLAKSEIGYNPSTSLMQGLKETWEWFLINQEEYLQKKNYFWGA